MTKHLEKPITLTEWNDARTKMNQPDPGMMQLNKAKGKEVDLDKIAANASKYYNEQAFECLECHDTGYVISDMPGPGKVYGKSKQTITFSHRCVCRANKRPWVEAKTHEEIPF